MGRWDEQINGLLEQVLNRPAFNYDFNADPLYQQYKNQYVQQGKQAMQDTVAQASALTGGYGNSYAAAAGSGAYQQYLNQLNGVIPELYEAAYARYQGEGNDMMDKLGVLQGMDNTDYGRYRDKVSDWESMLDYLTGRYDTERSFDYGTYRDKVSDWEDMRDYLTGRYDTERNFDYGSWRDSVGDWESMRDYYQNQQNWQKEFDFQQAQWNYKVAQEAAAAEAARQAAIDKVKKQKTGSVQTPSKYSLTATPAAGAGVATSNKTTVAQRAKYDEYKDAEAERRLNRGRA